MILDRLWWAERSDAKAHKKLDQEFKPQLDAAEKNGWEDPQGTLSGYFHERGLINGAECLRTKLLVKRARRLGIPVPEEPSGFDENDAWNFNPATGDYTLKPDAEARLAREVRKEEVAHLQYQMRWVSQVVVPIIGLIGAVMGLISLIHALRK